VTCVRPKDIHTPIQDLIYAAFSIVLFFECLP
jgi:hypothetical protein